MLMISLVVSLAACDLSSTPPTDQDIVGGWVHDGPGDEDSTLVMSADGSFSLDHVPRSVVSPVSGPGSPIDWSDVLDVTGTWSIGDYGNNSPFLNFDIDPSDGYGGFGTDMGVRGSGNSRQLFLQVGPGDDDRQFEFSRKTSQ
jgi:hypothetical protein